MFADPNLRRLQLAWGVSWAASTAYVLALSIYAFDHGGASAVGVLGVLRTLPAIVAAPLAAILIDRYRRERVLAIGLGVRTLLAAATTVAVLMELPLWTILALAAVDMAVSTTFWPAQAALIPTLARDAADITATNASSSTMEGLAVLLGPALGAGLLLWTGVSGVFYAASGLFFVAAVFGWRIRPEREREAVEARDDHEGIMAAAMGGVRALWEHKRAGFVVGMYLVFTGVVGAIGVLTVVIAIELLDAGGSGAGTLTSIAGVGGLIASVGTAGLAGTRRLAVPLAFGLAVTGGAIAAIGGIPLSAVALLGFAAYGAGYTVTAVTSLTLIQRLTPDEVLGRVMGVLEALYGLAIAAGAVLATLTVSWFGVRWSLVVVGGIALGVVAVALPMLRGIDRASDVPTEQLTLLRGLPMFAPLPVAALEEVAHRMVRIDVPAGEVIIRQGDIGDRFYVLLSGAVRVDVDGEPVPPLGPGEGFGEIALLRDVPRTATVMASEDTQLYWLGREDFLATVVGYAPAHRAAGEVATARLAAARPRIGMV